MRGSFTIGRIFGIDIGIHYTWLIAFFVIAWSLARGAFPLLFPGWSLATYWIAGVVGAILLFISVLIHEMCHSLVARSRGMKVSSIVLFIFGGVSNLEGEPEKASSEFIMAIVGPLSSLILGGIFAGITAAMAAGGDRSSPTFGVIYYMAYINVLLAIFNIIPGFPLDGGRVLRSIIWGATGNLRTATLVAGNIGRFFGWALIALGILLIFGANIWIFQGGILNGIWFIFIGWFLTSAADSAMRELTLQQALAGVRVRDVMDPTPECVSPAAPVQSIVHDSFIQRGRRALPICNESGLLGIVTLADVKRLPQDRWANTPVQEIMTRSPLESVDQNDDLNGALKLMAQKGLNQIPVMGDGRLMGLLSRSDVIRYLQTQQELGIKPKQNLKPV